MKITQLETIRLGEFPNIIWVRLHTGESLVGLSDTFMGAQAVDIALWDIFSKACQHAGAYRAGG